ncbi:MAG: pyrroline-5-carboxylate reductase [Clostridia bacterium]|nr:pyrroline-5-carboxylate reductase [Clostridia bacterium]
MTKYTAGFIGAGNMGGALAAAACKSVDPAQVIVADRDAEKARAFVAQYGCAVGDNAAVVKNSRFVFLGVKPQMLGTVAKELKPLFGEQVVLVSMLAGVTTERLASELGELPIIRIMPNTPAAIGEGMILYTANAAVSEADKAAFVQLLSAAGRLDEMPESLIDAGSAVSGCGPAFVYLFIEALADAGVQCGLPRDKALQYAAQTVCGAGRMAVIDGRHPAALKDAVCSPGGSTIEGVHALEDGAFRGIVMDAVQAAFRRTKELGK